MEKPVVWQMGKCIDPLRMPTDAVTMFDLIYISFTKVPHPTLDGKHEGVSAVSKEVGDSGPSLGTSTVNQPEIWTFRDNLIDSRTYFRLALARGERLAAIQLSYAR